VVEKQFELFALKGLSKQSSADFGTIFSYLSTIPSSSALIGLANANSTLRGRQGVEAFCLHIALYLEWSQKLVLYSYFYGRALSKYTAKLVVLWFQAFIRAAYRKLP
jgi:hypothetical protein